MDITLPGFLWMTIFSIYMLVCCLWKKIIIKSNIRYMLYVDLIGIAIYPFILFVDRDVIVKQTIFFFMLTSLAVLTFFYLKEFKKELFTTKLNMLYFSICSVSLIPLMICIVYGAIIMIGYVIYQISGGKIDI